MSAPDLNLSQSYWRRHFRKPVYAQIADHVVATARPSITDPGHAESLKSAIEHYQQAETEFLRSAVIPNRDTFLVLLHRAVDAARAEGAFMAAHPYWHGPSNSLRDNTESAAVAVITAIYPEDAL